VLEIEGPVRERGVTALLLRGELDLATAAELERAVRATGLGGHLVLDLRGLAFVDSTGLATMVRLEREARAMGGGLSCLVGPEGHVRRVLDVTRLGEVLGAREAAPAGEG
jgi:anti-sigma B factor antagonist